MCDDIDCIKQKIDKNKKTIIILVGESGAGKSTFCNFVDLPDLTYTSSGAIINELSILGLPKTHKNIHTVANEKYANDPEWQIPYILSALDRRGILLLDGPRRIREVEALREHHINTPIITISSSRKNRSMRLAGRDEVDEDEFRRIQDDEANETELNEILALSDITINNDDDLVKLQKGALSLRKLIRSLERVPK